MMAIAGWQLLRTELRAGVRPGKSLPIREAWRQVEAWLACPPVWVPAPTDGGPRLGQPALTGHLIMTP
jgi:hypothetical protein